MLQANINTVNVESVPRQNDAPLIVHSRPPKSPRPPPYVRSQAPPLVRRSVLSADENLEITSYLQRQPATTTTSRSRRAVSVPPPGAALPPPRPSVPRWFPTSSTSYYGHRRYGVAAPLPVRLPPAPATHLPSDTVVGVAHTSQYGDIVIGIPYKKRFMFNAQVARLYDEKKGKERSIFI